ncbi:MAG: glycosyltransferase [Saprospiraceae bacterium]
MRVLMIPSWYFPYASEEIGGRMFHELSIGLKEHEIDVQILFADFSRHCSFSKEINIAYEAGILTWRIRQWFPPKINSSLIQLWVNKYVRTILRYIDAEGKPDLIHAQSYMAGMVCEALHRKTNIPYIITERVSTFITGQIPERHKKFIRRSFENATGLTCVSPGLKIHLTPYTSKSIEVIPNFYDPDIFYRDEAVQKFKTFTWLSVGEPSYVKGLDLLLKAFAVLKEKFDDVQMQLLLLDKIKEQEELKELSRHLGIDKYISWKGLVSHVEVAGVMRQSHVLISASRTETFGKTILEAQASGLPVIATKTDGATFIINSPEQGILVELNDVDALAIAMETMYRNYSLYHSGAIVASVKSRFKKGIVIEEWKKFYHKIIM